MRTMASKMLRPVFEFLGLLSPPGDESPPAGPGSPTCEDRLKHMKGLGFDAKVIYDCGAFIGRWALDVSAIYPQSELVLVEPNPHVHQQIIANTSSINERVRVVAAAVSDHEGVGILNVWDDPRHKNRIIALAASSLMPHVQGKAAKEVGVRVTTIDAIVEETGKQPDLLKLDLQGGERKALLGAGKTLERTEFCIVEFGCLEAYIARSTPRDLMDLMYDHGFCLYDIVDLIYRPYDGALAGGDFFFIKRDSRLREHKDYF